MGIKKVVSLTLPMISIAIFCVLLSTQHCAAAATIVNEKGGSLIKKTCAKTKFPDVCSSTLESDPQSSKVTDVKGLSKIGLELVFTKGKEVVEVAHDLVNKAHDYDLWSRRVACMSSYNMSIYNVKDNGLPSLDATKYKNVYEILEKARSEIAYCSTLNVPELSKSNTIMTSFLIDLKSIVHLLF